MAKTPIEVMLDSLIWTPIEGEVAPDDRPYATHSGVLNLGEFNLRVYQLSDGNRVFESSDFEQFVDRLSGIRSRLSPALNEWLDLFE